MSWEIPVFKVEKNDGVAKEVRAQSSIAYSCLIQPSDLNAYEFKENVEKFLAAAGANLNKQRDLFYLNTILVTTGWNKNTDIFDKREVWAARSTPEDKPFNYGHNQDDIIGHITGSYAVGEDYKAIDNDSAIDDLPSKFHLLTSAVIYRALEREESRERIEKIIAEISEGKWYVSMECLFRNFDYGLTGPNGEQKVIARNEETAGLTKYLRQYKGEGKYNGHAIGRVLRDITFCGKGLVANPANPESLILQNFDGGSAKSVYINLTSFNQEKCMADNNLDNKDETVTLKARVSQLETEVAAKATELSDKVKEVSVLQAEKTELQKSVAKLETDLKVSARTQTIVDMGASLDEAKAMANTIKVLDDEACAKLLEQLKDKWSKSIESFDNGKEEGKKMGDVGKDGPAAKTVVDKDSQPSKAKKGEKEEDENNEDYKTKVEKLMDKAEVNEDLTLGADSGVDNNLSTLQTFFSSAFAKNSENK